jgi:threonyl-tRNA synthetase
MAEQDDLYILRHSTAHVMAQAVCDLWPGAKYAIGPPIEDGFYYDFELPEQLAPDDLAKIEKRMRHIVKQDQPFTREEVSREEGLKRFADQPYKKEIIEGVEEEEGAKGDAVSIYKNGGWEDLCLGPHVSSTKKLGAFKLMSIAGAYWRGDEHNTQLQRIYGTAWPTQEELDDYLHRIEEAEKRDHRKLGPQLDLFSFPEELGAGLAVWHPKGGLFRKTIEDYLKDLHLQRGYEIVVTPNIAKSILWETSGHLEKYAETMYPPMERTHEGGQTEAYYVKPMNCPFHVLIYKSQTRSYRDLPMRLSELGAVYRYEKAGVLHGLLRIRGFTQDDSHIICTPDQLVDEVIGAFDLTLEILKTFGFEGPRIALSTKPGVAIGDEEMWAKAEEALRQALDKSGVEYELDEGEGAFYGPKIDFHFRDAIGRLWQLTTIQVDFALPERFEMEYAGEDNERHRPVMIHRAILGSIERFSGVLIEHYAGAFPLWLSPEQVRVIPIADRHHAHGETLVARLREEGIRAHSDASSETLNKRIRDAQMQKVPYVLVAGDKEIEAGSVSVRNRAGEEKRGVPFEAFVARAVAENGSRALETGNLDELG